MLRTLYLSLLLSFSGSLLAQKDSPNIPQLLLDSKNKINIASQDIAAYDITDQYTSQQTGITHTYLTQKHQDIRVHNGILNLNTYKSQLISFGNRWIYQLAEKAPAHIPSLDPLFAVELAATHLSIPYVAPSQITSEENTLGQVIKFVFSSTILSKEEIKTQLTWLPSDHKAVMLCWMIEWHETGTDNIWNIFIDAHTGTFIKKDNLVIQCSFGERPLDAHASSKASASCSAMPPVSVLPADSSYRVFGLTIESPNHGDRSLITKPWEEAGISNPAITLGWHNDGTTTYTKTRGNNVFAYEDIDANNVPGYSPDTANMQFDYPFIPSLPPASNQAAAITNLFYWNNLLHDIMYQYGFDEVSGNFQQSNMGRGGIGSDYVQAEALDGGGTNNANFSTPSDGSKPRMQMYLWSPVSSVSPLYINAPESIEGEMPAVESGFSTQNKLADIGLTTGELVLVDDAGADTHLACGELDNGNSLAGKIAVIDRGTCSFVIKVKKVQTLGAIAAIVINNITGAPFGMGGSDNSITIPAVMVSLSDGNLLKDAMEEGSVTVSLDSVPGAITPDGDYDNGIICHEYGHGISNRLTGGPTSVNCLNNDEQMGEGWSDFFGLMLTTDWTSASPTDRRGIGTYVLGEPTDGDGIRTYPYTTDTLVNPFTYADIADAPVSNGNPSPHFIGSVWSTMLWDMTWAIIDIAGVDTDMYHGTGGNNIALSLVMNGLKLQPCNPGFVDGRDAILLADEILYGGQYKCAIWNAFARRGLGVGAVQGNTDNHLDGLASFAIPNSIKIQSSSVFPESTEGQELTFLLTAICECEDKTDVIIKDRLSDDLIYVPGSGGVWSGDTVEFTVDSLSAQDTIYFEYNAIVTPCSFSPSIPLSIDDVEGTNKYVSIKLAGTGTKEWVKNTTHFVSPTRSWYATNYSTFSDFALTLINPVAAGNVVKIEFQHRYKTEANFDGGVVEYTLNNGVTWIDAGPWFTENGYPSTITTGGTDSPIAGRPAFTGDSDAQFDTVGFVHSTIQLFIPEDQSMKIRFRFSTDSGVGGSGINGWYIDNINIHEISGVVNETRVTINDVLQDSILYGTMTSYFEGTNIYVDENASGGRNGYTWGNAMRYLPAAFQLAGCRALDSVFVAEGIYVPTLTTIRTTSFTLPDSTSVFGGFPAGGGAFGSRDPLSYITLLSGDIGAVNDGSDNVYHVVKIDSAQKAIVLDGVHISGGNANGAGDNNKGAAVFCEGELLMNKATLGISHGTGDGQIIYNRGVSAKIHLYNCTIQSPDDHLIKLLNINSGQLRFEGNTVLLKE